MNAKPTYDELLQRIKELEEEKRSFLRNSDGITGGHHKVEKSSEIAAGELIETTDDLAAIINVEKLQSIMNDFHFLTGMVTAILDLNGTIIEATGWQDICTRFHRAHPETAKNCTESDLYLASHLKPGEFINYRCKNGLWDVVTPLYVGDKHMGNLYTGQFFYDDDSVDEQIFINQSESFDFDKNAYMDAFRRIPRYSRETIDHLMGFLVKFTSYISSISYANTQLENEIHERKRIEARLRKSEERLRAIFEAARNVSFIITDARDPEPTILEFSPGAEAIFGYPKSDLLGMPVSALHIPEDVKNFPQAHQQMRQGRAGFSGETTLVRKTGEKFPALFSTYPLFDEYGEMYAALGVSFDLSNQKQLEAQLQRSSKMESVGRLAGGIAHEFNNMMSIIIGNTEMLMDDVDIEGRFAAHLKEIRKAAERSADLTRQLLSFARKQTISPRLLDLNELIEGMSHMLQRLVGESIELILIPEEKLWPVNIDPSQIDQILVNLSINSRDAIQGVGRILIETGNVTIDADYCKAHTDSQPGEYAMLSVSDNGCGMDRQTLGKLFEPFFTTKEVGQGSGLGLSMVYGIVRQNNGFVNVYSELGQGTTFRIYFPKFSNPENQEQKTDQPHSRATGRETILLVEDEPAILRMMTMMLERLGYEVLPAGTPVEALQIGRSDDRKIHLLMTDVVMPEMSGKDLAGHLERLHPDIKCLFMSGYTANVIAHHGILDKGVNFINKPFSKKDLSAKVRAVLDQSPK